MFLISTSGIPSVNRIELHALTFTQCMANSGPWQDHWFSMHGNTTMKKGKSVENNEISMTLEISGYMDLFLWGLPATNGG